MRVEGEDAVVHIAGGAVGGGFVDEPGEEGQTLFHETFGMPLDAKDALVLAALDGLDGAVRGCGGDAEQRASFANGLMMEGVDVEYFFLIIYII